MHLSAVTGNGIVDTIASLVYYTEHWFFSSIPSTNTRQTMQDLLEGGGTG